MKRQKSSSVAVQPSVNLPKSAMQNLYTHKRQRDLVGGGDSDQRQEKHSGTRGPNVGVILVSSALHGMRLKLTEI